jgi:hypothetical protein
MPDAPAHSEIRAPDLAGVVAVADAVGLPHVVIGVVDIMRSGLPPLEPIPGLDN